MKPYRPGIAAEIPRVSRGLQRIARFEHLPAQAFAGRKAGGEKAAKRIDTCWHDFFSDLPWNDNFV